MWTDVIGIVGSICFAVSGLPPAYEAYKARSCSYSKLFLALWFVGESSCIIYAVAKGTYPLLLNYLPNMACLLILIRFNRR